MPLRQSPAPSGQLRRSPRRRAHRPRRRSSAASAGIAEPRPFPVLVAAGGAPHWLVDIRSPCRIVCALMIGTYASAALICAASLLLAARSSRRRPRELVAGSSRRSALPRSSRSPGCWRRLPGGGTTARSLGLLALLAVGAGGAAACPTGSRGALAPGAAVALALVLVLSIPFAISGRWGLLGVGFNNDLGLHLAWSEWLRSGFGPEPDAGYPLGPHGVAIATAAFPRHRPRTGVHRRAQAITILTGLTALGALGGLGAGPAGARGDAGGGPLPGRLLLRPGRLQGDGRGPLRARLRAGAAGDLAAARRRAGCDWRRPGAARSCSLARDLLLLQLRRPRLADRDRGALEPHSARRCGGRWLRARCSASSRRPATLAWVAGLAAAVRCSPSSGRSASPAASARSPAATPTARSPPSRRSVSGPPPTTASTRVGGAPLAGIAVAVGAAWRSLAGLFWWVRRGELAVPIALARLRPALPGLAPLQRRLLAGEGADDRLPAGDADRCPGAARRARPAAGEARRRPRGPAARARARPCGGSAGRRWPRLPRRGRLLDLPRAARGPGRAAGPRGRAARLPCPSCTGENGPLRRARTDSPPTSCSAPTPTSPWSSSPTPTSSRARPSRSTPATPTARSTSTRSPTAPSTTTGYVITGSAAWNSQAPPNFREVGRTPSYILWEREERTPQERQTLLEGTEPAAPVDCACARDPDLRRPPRGAPRSSPTPVIGPKDGWEAGPMLKTGERRRRRSTFPAGRWRLSLQYFSPFGLTLSAPGFERAAGARARRPAAEHDQPLQRRPVLACRPRSRCRRPGRSGSRCAPPMPARSSALPATTARPSSAAWSRCAAGPHRTMPLASACGRWLDYYEGTARARGGRGRPGPVMRCTWSATPRGSARDAALQAQRPVGAGLSQLGDAVARRSRLRRP